MAGGLTGSLTQWPMAELLRMLSTSGQSGRLEVTSGTQRADVYLEGGELVHAALGLQRGEPVVTGILGWTKGIFSFSPGSAPVEATITRELEVILSESQATMVERETIMRIVPSTRAVPSILRARPPAAVTIEPEEWELLATVDGRANVAEIADLLGSDEASLVKSIVRLAGLGLLDVEVPVERQQTRDIVNPAFFSLLEHAAAAALGPLAEVIVDDAVAALGTTRTEMTRDGVTGLIELVAQEISEDARRIRFQQQMLQWVRAQAA